MPVDSKYIEARALDYSNVPLIDRRVVASVHLENRDDEFFWDTLLQHNKPGKYNYIYESRVEKEGPLHSGVDQCLRYKPYLTPTFFICIDSDLRYLLQESDIDAQHRILQTYTYSWEQHYCIAEEIQTQLANISLEAASKFNFPLFLSKLSQIAYEPLLCLLESLNNKRVTRSIIGEFNDCFPSQCMAPIFVDNGEQLLRQIVQNLQRFMSKPMFLSIDLSAAKVKYNVLGLNETNTYLHLRGHNISGLINHIGNMLCSPHRINFKQQVLIPSLKLNGYWEIEKVTNDAHQILDTHLVS